MSDTSLTEAPSLDWSSSKANPDTQIGIDSADTPYRTPESILADEAEEEHLLTFVDRNSDYYLNEWRTFDVGGTPSFNLASFFLSGLWLSYRKMYRHAAALIGILVLFTSVEFVISTTVLGQEAPPAVFGLLFNLAVAITCGAYGNRWYLNQAKAIITDTRAQGWDEETFAAKLARRGGTNTAAALGFLMVLFISQFAALILLQVFLGVE